jgi:hypothetical protein
MAGICSDRPPAGRHLARLPIWMTEDQTMMMVTQIPRLSLAGLRELRLELDARQSLLRDDPRREETSMPRQQPRHRLPDLFVPKDPPMPMAASEQTKLLPQVSALLSETLAEDHA